MVEYRWAPLYYRHMNKAFTKESDDEEQELESRSDIYTLPKGVRNYMTPAGAAKLQAELRALKYDERPKVVDTVAWAAGNGDRSENADYQYGKKRLRQIDKRIEFLLKRLESTEVIDPLTVKSDQILFGASVTIRDENDREKSYSIVGVDEIEVAKGKISWRSPLANALLKKREGDIVTFLSPKGEQEIEVIKVRYIAIVE